ncbi:MAG: sigma-70 family RNA polymerase sigma factor [Fimbriimonadaceae bacterium]|nr:sigma-70 family RNA polymerase sigma factor [Armatimonadota bacterium]
MVSISYEQSHSAFDDDLVLVDRVLSDDTHAFQSLYEKYHDKVFAIARGILLDSEEAHDAVQEIFTLVYTNLHRFDRRAKFSTWLFRIAVNRSIQQSRKLKYKKLQSPISEQVEMVPEAPEEMEMPDPFVERSMARMHPNDRAILTLFYWDELNLQEIAESINCSANAAKTRLFRARERFKTIYEEEVAK